MINFLKTVPFEFMQRFVAENSKAPLSLFAIMLISNLIVPNFAGAQDVEIYHGINPTTTILKGEAKNKVAPGTKFTIRIRNPNPFFYTYSIKLDTSPIVIDTPPFEELISLLPGELKILKPETGDKQNGRERPEMEQLYFDNVSNEMHIFYEKVLEEIRDIEKSYNRLDSIIATSDVPNSPEDASEFTLTKGKVAQLSDLALNEKLFEAAQAKAKTLDSLSVPKMGTNEYLILTLKNHALNLINKRNELKRYFLSFDDTIVFETTIKEEQETKIYISIAKKGKTGIRQTGEKLFVVTITPNYRGKRFELVPLGSMVFEGKTKQYGLENGIITLKEADQFPFRPGILFTYNFARFGERDLNSLGVGIGTAISAEGQSLNNFQGAFMLSFADKFRIGLGAGYSQVPGSLKNGNAVGNMITGDAEKIDDIINYEKKLALYLNFSIFGLDIVKLFQ